MHRFAGNTRRSPAFEPLMYVVSVGGVVMEAKHDGIANGISETQGQSATFEQLLAFGATFCGFSNLEQVLPFRAIFEQNIGLEHISSTKKSTIFVISFGKTSNEPCVLFR